MKKITLLILCFVISTVCFAQIQSNCSPLPNLKTLYERDVEYLALKRMYAINSPDTVFISIPQPHLDTIWNGLAAIVNLQTQLEVDSVFKVYCIHDDVARRGTTIKVYVNTDTPWTQAWQGMITHTGYGALDTLMNEFGFSVINFNYSTNYYTRCAVIRTNKVINYRPLLRKLDSLKGVFTSVFDNFYIGINDQISYTKDTSQRYQFSMGWSDCLSGCNNMKMWEYEVEDCKVSLLQTQLRMYAPDYRDPTNCNLNVSVSTLVNTDKLQVFPNPASEYIIINSSEKFSYQLYNLTGIKLQSGTASAGKKIMINDYPSGYYFLMCVTNNGERQVVKFNIVK